MPYKKNVQREAALLKHWHQGDTVKFASALTGIPEGTVGHYYARFNRRKDLYRKLSENGGYQEPPRTSPFNAAIMAKFLVDVCNRANQLMAAGEYGKARDFMQTILLLQDFCNRVQPILQNLDPEKVGEALQNAILLIKMT